MRPRIKWSVPPALPPATETALGLLFSAATNSFQVLILPLAGTTTTPASSVRRAIGVTLRIVTGLLLEIAAPTITEPPTMSELPWPLRWFTKRGSPTIPPAPPTFSNCIAPTRPAALAARSMARAVPSQPPPGAAGTNMLIVSKRALGCAQAGSAAAAAPATPKVRNSRLERDMGSSPERYKTVRSNGRCRLSTKPARSPGSRGASWPSENPQLVSRRSATQCVQCFKAPQFLAPISSASRR